MSSANLNGSDVKDSTIPQLTVSSRVDVNTSAGVERVTMVGDRGMLKQAGINLLNDKRFHYTTAITKSQMQNP